MFDFLIDKVISDEVEHQKKQSEYFAARAKTGGIVTFRMWQPFVEPQQGDLVAVFVEPGAAHLVFWDEVAPFAELDTKYRKVREQVFGRYHDVESLEFDGKYVKFVNNFSTPNVYESSFHWTAAQDFTGDIYSDTWNHMLSVAGTMITRARGGYRAVQYELLTGDRAAAEGWVKHG